MPTHIKKHVKQRKGFTASKLTEEQQSLLMKYGESFPYLTNLEAKKGIPDKTCLRRK